MAFSDADQVRISDRLGFARRFLSLDTALLQAIAAVGSDAAVQALVITLLNDCDRVDKKLASSQSRQSVASVDKNDVVLNGYREIVALRSEGRRYVGRIARLLGVQPRGDCFSGSIDANVPNYGPLQGMYSNGPGNLMKIG